MPSDRRDRLIDTALELFCRDGFHATGIDRILAEAGVAKMTLYNHFRSKDDLILAALRRRDETFRNWFVRAVERRARAPRDRLLALFDTLDEWFGQKTFRGCMFINAAAEFGNGDNPMHTAAAEHKRLFTAYITGLAKEAGATDPPRLAVQLCLLVEGAIVLAHVGRVQDAARNARDAAAVLVRDAIPEERSVR